MLSRFQAQIASGFGAILILAAAFAALVAGVRFGGENVVMRWLIGIVAFVVILILLAPVVSALNGTACDLSYTNC